MNPRRHFLSDALLLGLTQAVPTALGASLLGASAAVRAQAKGSEGIDQMREFMIGAKSARGDFEQKIVKTNGTGEATSGSFSFVRPGKFRWEVRKPFSQVMVSDGSQLFFYDKDLNQVVVRKLTDVLGATPAAILFGSNEFERNFKITALPARGDAQWIEAVPVVSGSREAGFEKMSIGFRSNLPVGMEVKDAFGRTALFSFAGIQRNAVIAETEFRFTIPAGAEVVRQ